MTPVHLHRTHSSALAAVVQTCSLSVPQQQSYSMPLPCWLPATRTMVLQPSAALLRGPPFPWQGDNGSILLTKPLISSATAMPYYHRWIHGKTSFTYQKVSIREWHSHLLWSLICKVNGATILSPTVLHAIPQIHRSALLPSRWLPGFLCLGVALHVPLKFSTHKTLSLLCFLSWLPIYFIKKATPVPQFLCLLHTHEKKRRKFHSEIPTGSDISWNSN